MSGCINIINSVKLPFLIAKPLFLIVNHVTVDVITRFNLQCHLLVPSMDPGLNRGQASDEHDGLTVPGESRQQWLWFFLIVDL